MPKPKKEPIKSVKGMHDILPDDVPYYDRAIKETRRVAEFYGFRTIRTPHVEPKELFTASLGDMSDIVSKQMYAFRTRGGTSVVLRPEGTAPIVRAYVEHGMQSWPQPVKLFYSGSFFRHETPQAGRTREFQQAGMEVLGEKGAVNDALVIRILVSSLEAMHLHNIIVHINNIGDESCRPQYIKELSAYYRKRQQMLCEDCKRRLKENPLRLLDCKHSQCAALKLDAPQIIDYLSHECTGHFQAVLEFLDEMGIAYRLNPYLVRGLDYYTNTVFELFIGDEGVAELKQSINNKEKRHENVMEDEKQGEKETQYMQQTPTEQVLPIAIGAGGRYDMLVQALYNKPIPAVGGSLGIDRVVLEMKRRGLKVRPEIRPKVFVVQLGVQARKKTLAITEELRKGGIPLEHALGKNDSLTRQLHTADKFGTPYALIIGQKEAIEGRAILREMRTGAQELVAFEKIVSVLKMRLKQ